jgi:hypothetical protein
MDGGATLQISSPFDAASGTPAPSFDEVFGYDLGAAHFDFHDAGTTINSPHVVIGGAAGGTGVATQSAGVHAVDALTLGAGRDGHGMYVLTGGELRVTSGPVVVGAPGEGVFYLGNLDGTGHVSQQSAATPVDLAVGRHGTLHGWGEVALTGRLTNNGAIVANGYGQQRTLDLTTFTSVSGDATGRAGRGWYAVGGARLDLPAIPVAAGTSTITWGGRNDGSDLSLVNSARLTFHDVATPASVAISLLSLDRTDVPAFPAGHHLVGVWAIDQGGLDAPGGMDLLVRYDEAVAAAKGLDEHVLKLWTYADATGWVRHDFDDTFVRDADRHTVYAHVAGDGVTYFAVSAPEPGTITLLAIGTIGLLTSRRRRARTVN